MRDGETEQTCQQFGVHADIVCQAREQLLDDAAYVDLAQLFGALADSTRARIVHLLLHEELCTCDLGLLLGVTDSCVSQHLRVLRALRLVKSRRGGKFVYYSLDDAHIALVVQTGLTHLGHASSDAIGTLAGLATREQ